MGLADGKPTKDIGHRNPHTADARTAAPLARLDGNDVLVVYGAKPSIFRGSAQQCFAGP